MTNKKGVSVIIGYVLLVVFAVIISAVVYNWLKTYIPSEKLECSEGVSILIKDAKFDGFDSILNLTIVNNGRFNLAGYIIDAKNTSEEELATIDLTEYLNESYENTLVSTYASAILILSSEETIDSNNQFEPGDEVNHIFNIPEEIGELQQIRIIPVRFEEHKGRLRFTVCGNAGIEQESVTIPAWIVFALTNTVLQGNLGGLSGADNLCNNRAQTAGLNGTYIAWLSTSTINAKDRIADVIYALPNNLGEPVIKVIGGKADLSTGDISHQINRTAYGVEFTSNGAIWTGTDEYGNTVANSNCNSWTSSSSGVLGTIGRSYAKDFRWTNSGNASCNDDAYAIYCFQVTE